MRLLLDEMIDKAVAEQLRQRGHNVRAVTEDAALRAIADEDLFEHIQPEQRTIVTHDVDFLSIGANFQADQRAHHGIVLLNSRRFPQRAGTVGPLVAALEKLIDGGPPYRSFVHWLA